MDDPAAASRSLKVEIGAGEDVIAALSRDGASDRAADLVRAALARMMDELGLPGSATVQLVAIDTGSHIEVGTGGATRAFPGALEYARARNVGESRPPITMLPLELAESLASAVIEIVGHDPAILLGRDQVAMYRQSLDIDGVGAIPDDDGWLRSVLSPVVGAGISIGSRAEVGETLLSGSKAGLAPEDLAEALIDALAPGLVEIHLPEVDARNLTLGATDDDRSVMSTIRTGPLLSMGVRFPRLTFVRDAQLAPGSYQVRLNHVTTQPWRGIAPHEVFVAASPDALEMPARAALDPRDGSTGSVVDAGSAATLGNSDFEVYRPMGHLGLCLGHELAGRARWFVQRSTVAEKLDRLGLLYPRLVQAVRRRWPDERVTQVLRELVSEHIPILDQEWFMDRLMRFDWTVVPTSSSIVLDDVLATVGHKDPSGDRAALAAFVRQGLAVMTDLSGLDHPDARAFVLDEDLEAELVRSLRSVSTNPAAAIEIATLDRLRASIVDMLPAGVSDLPLLVSTFEIRRLCRMVVPFGWGRLPIHSRAEWPRGMNVEEVRVISLQG